MTERKKCGILTLLIAVLVFTSAFGTAYADQPYRGTTKHKRSLRNADISRAPDRYTDIDGTTKDADKNTVSISFTSDMEKDMESYARVATYFKAESGHYPRSFLLDAGNYSAEQPYYSVFAQYYPGLAAMGKAGYDIVGIGPSEVSQGGIKLTGMLNNAAKDNGTLPYITTANIEGTNDLMNAYKKYGVNDYLDMNKYRTEVAVFSVVSEEAFAAAAPDKLRYEDAVKRAKKIVAEIKKDEDADIIVCMCASGTGSADSKKVLEKRIAKSVDGIDVIISAGSNTELVNPLKVNDTRIFALALGNKRLGRIEFTIENNEYHYSGYRTVKLDDRYKKDPDTLKTLQKIAETADKNYFAANGFASGQVLCDSFFEMAPLQDNAGKKGNAPLGEFIADAYRYGATEDAKIPKGNLIAISSDLSAKSGIKEGKLKVNDIYGMMSSGKSANGTKGQAITTFFLKGEDIRALAEIAAASANDPSSCRIYFSGLSYKYNPYRFKDKRVYDITALEDATGSQIVLKDDVLYRIVTDNETAAAIPELSIKENEALKVVPKDENGKETSQMNELMRSIDKEKPLKTWIATSEYASTFIEAGIPATYKEADGRMVYDDSKEFSHVYKGEMFTLMQLLLVAIIGLVALAVLILLILDLAGVKIKRKK